MRLKNENKGDYRKLQEYVQKLNVAPNTSYRGGCPSCGGINSFSVTNERGGLKWYCFRASCKISGHSGADTTLMGARELLAQKEPDIKEPLLLNETVGWQSNLKDNARAWKYIQDNNCEIALNAHPQKFYYDNVNDRVVFTENVTVNSFGLATGRSLSGSKPKWFKYVALPGVYFTLNNTANSESIFIVEDCASACSLYRIGSSVALCGTSFNLYALAQLLARMGGKRLMVCLDTDARLTALRLRADLNSLGDFESVGVGLLSNDAKYLQLDRLKKELGYAENSKDAIG